MLGRFIADKYNQDGKSPVQEELVQEISKSDYVIANLESAVAPEKGIQTDHLSFLAPKELLGEFKWINLFSTANNHINDGGNTGIEATLENLNRFEIPHNGIFEYKYQPYIIETQQNKIAIITLTDMLNVEFPKDNKWELLRMGDERVEHLIKNLKVEGYFVILFAHVGMLFTRYPNPITRNYLHKCVDWGCNLIVTAHSHCVGGYEYYSDTLIMHSLGDFVMDGSSFRRRRSSYLTVEIENNKIKDWNLNYAQTGFDLKTRKGTKKVQESLRKSVSSVYKNLTIHKDDYVDFYKKQYKKEMLAHTLSTLNFLYKERGLVGLLKMLKVRANETKRMAKWATSDRSRVQRDDDALTDRIDNSKLKK